MSRAYFVLGLVRPAPCTYVYAWGAFIRELEAIAVQFYSYSAQYNMAEWRELESDPGLFSLLIEDCGVTGVRVEEVYDITRKLEGKVYGFVFLFRWGGERRARKKSMAIEDSYVMESEIVNRMFFAHQIINNSCATHSLLSVLLNCPNIDLGPTLSRLKEFTAGLDPESKGLAIANMVELAQAHNKHARPSHVVAPPPGGRRGSVMSSAHALLPETYHFVSYVPIRDRLFELDGLKEFPIDHGPWGEEEEWTDLFQRVIKQRLENGQDILFNLMAVVEDPLPQLSDRLRLLHSQQAELLGTAIQLVREKRQNGASDEKGPRVEELEEEEIPEMLREAAQALPEDQSKVRELALRDIPDGAPIDERLLLAVAKVTVNDQDLEANKQRVKEELETKRRYRIEFHRRTHNYDPLITTFITALVQNGQLPPRLTRRLSNSHTGRSGGGQRRNSVRPPLRGRSDASKHRKPKTTLLVNGTKV